MSWVCGHEATEAPACLHTHDVPPRHIVVCLLTWSLRHSHACQCDVRESDVGDSDVCDSDVCDSDVCDSDVCECDVSDSDVCDSDVCDSDVAVLR